MSTRDIWGATDCIRSLACEPIEWDSAPPALQVFQLFPKKIRVENRKTFKAYDGLNNLFNLAYSVLKWKAHRAIIRAKLEPYLGFLYSAEEKRARAISERGPFLFGELEMNILRIMLLTLLLLSLPFLSCVLAAPPAIQRQMEIIEATIEGGSIATVDPAAIYDTASARDI